MDLIHTTDLTEILALSTALVSVFVTIIGMFRLVLWSKRMPKGAIVFLAVFPLLSLFPIPPQEIKKLENIRKEQMKMNEGVELSHLSSMNSEMPKSELKIGILRLILPSIIDLKKLESLGLNIQEPPSPIGISMKHKK